MACGSSARAEPDPNVRQPTVEWNSAWPRFRPAEYAITGALVTIDIGIAIFAKDPDPRWDDVLPFDGAVGTYLRAGTGKGRRLAQWWSDRMHEANFVIGFFEAPVVAFAVHRDADVGWQLAMMNTEAFAAAGLVQLVSSRLVGRVRPFVKHCRDKAAENEGDDFPCKAGGGTLSFLSGHAMTSFVSAGLMCAHHARLPLYGGGAGDIAACVGMLASATTTSVLRIVADKHYTSDVVIGAVLGVAFGFGLPMLLHYRGEAKATPTTTAAAAPIIGWGSTF